MAAVKGPDTMGDHVRRFIVWTKSAFEKLDEIYRQMTVNSSFPWLMVISRSLKENGLSNLVKGKFWCSIFCISFLVICVSEDD
ncbi:unnamed protein product [Coffea canephora]|uniref:DH200=94 genomic scaffold, scaffold_9258 n=1 Tax=Coffea canephora TaxID=49390 RepID=A0A068VN43_COFCA|nr:unnamed protein product [Coffea canephora]